MKLRRVEPGSAAANLRRLVLGPALVVVLCYALALLGGGALLAFLGSPVDSVFTAFVATTIGVLGCGLVLRAVARWVWDRGSHSSLLTGFIALWALGLVGGTWLFFEVARAVVQHELQRQTLDGPVVGTMSLGPGDPLGPALGTGEPFTDCMTVLGQREVRADAMRAASPAGLQADEVVYKVMLRVCGKHARGRIRDLPTYFRKSVTRAAWKVARREWRVDSCPLEQICSRDPETEYLQAESLQIVQTALCELDGQQRDVVKLRCLNDERFADIGATLGISEANARQLYKRGIDRIRTRISLEELRCEFGSLEK